jgi:spore maturation protein CgeB
MRAYGACPSVRLFEAAACGACVVSDDWPDIEQFYRPEAELLVAHERADVLAYLDLAPEQTAAIGAAARSRTLRDHTYDARAVEFERAVAEARSRAAFERSDAA